MSVPHVVASRISLRTAATNDVVQAAQAVHQVVHPVTLVGVAHRGP